MTRLELLHSLMSRHDVVVISGGPNTGKSWLAENHVKDRPLVQTDDWVDYDWPDVPALAAAEALKHRRCVIEGVRAASVLRHGVKVGAILWLTKPMEPLSKKDREMAQARLKALVKMQREGWLDGVEVEFEEDR